MAAHASNLWMAARLLRVTSRPINAVVDLTNYCMFDWGQPSHVFDAQHVTGSLEIDTVQAVHELELLDGEKAMIPVGSLIIKDDTDILSLAGIIGGKRSMYCTPSAALIESSAFDSTLIRTTSTALHVRTQASARFEKELDPNQNVMALARIVMLGHQLGVFTNTPTIVSLGKKIEPTKIMLKHSDIERLIGIPIPPAFVVKTLQALEFGIFQEEDCYQIVVPTWRNKDIKIAADIIEDIVRFWGLDAVPATLPELAISPKSLQGINEIRAIKNYMAFACDAHEVNNYPLFNENLLHALQWRPDPELIIKNPVAQTAKVLVNSLLPNLLKNSIDVEMNQQNRLNFFEVNAVWHFADDRVYEHRSCAGIFYNPHHELDFYHYKASLSTLFGMLKRDITWEKNENNDVPWFHPYKTAALRCGTTLVGFAGLSNPLFMQKIGNGHAFIFELNVDLLLSLPQKPLIFQPLPKYQASWLDISFLAPCTLTITELKNIIMSVDTRIFDVALQDMFYKESWGQNRSVLMRFFIRDECQTMTKEQIATVQHAVTMALEGRGAVIR